MIYDLLPNTAAATALNDATVVDAATAAAAAAVLVVRVQTNNIPSDRFPVVSRILPYIV